MVKANYNRNVKSFLEAQFPAAGSRARPKRSGSISTLMDRALQDKAEHSGFILQETSVALYTQHSSWAGHNVHVKPSPVNSPIHSHSYEP